MKNVPYTPVGRKRSWLDVILVLALVSAAVVIIVTVVIFFLPGSRSGSLGLPLVEPPVRSSAPADLQKSTAGAAAAATGPRLSSISTQNMRERLFSPSPANVYTILGNVDMRIKEMNMRADQFPCINGTTYVNYTLSTWGDDPVVLRAQCAERWIPHGFILVSLNADSTMHLYDRSQEVAVAALVTMNMTNSTVEKVEVWYSVGLSSRNGSAGVVHIVAQPNATRFELAVAGRGMGYCGAQMISDGTTVRLTGSEDLGYTCVSTDTVCVSAANISVVVNCTEGVSKFALRPLGRQSYVDASNTTLDASYYPGGANNTVVLRADGNDTSLFGPSVIPTGL
jgi:hypothetical protein